MDKLTIGIVKNPLSLLNYMKAQDARIDELESVTADLRADRDKANAKIRAREAATQEAEAKRQAKADAVLAAKKRVAAAEAKETAEAEAKNRLEAAEKETAKKLAADKKLIKESTK